MKTNPYNLADMNLGGRVLFVVPDNFQDDNVFPLGPGYLTAILRMAGGHVETYCMDVFHYTGMEKTSPCPAHQVRVHVPWVVSNRSLHPIIKQ